MSQTIPSEDAITNFTDRLSRQWLPTYCEDPKRMYSVAGYRPNSNKITSQDASDFLRAIDNHVVDVRDGGRYHMPQSKADEVIFWEGSKDKVPRPITLWMEPVITIASLARLHLDFGWPKHCLGTQSERWAFDLMAFLPENLDAEHIAGEVKRSSRELQSLIVNMHALGQRGNVDVRSLSPAKVNAYKKILGLLRSRAPLFWAVGPAKENHLFEVSYLPDSRVSLREMPSERLAYPGGN